MHVDIKVRYSTGAYHATSPNSKARASSTNAAKFAAGALLEKLHPDASIEREEVLQQGTNSSPSITRYHLQPEQ